MSSAGDPRCVSSSPCVRPATFVFTPKWETAGTGQVCGDDQAIDGRHEGDYFLSASLERRIDESAADLCAFCVPGEIHTIGTVSDKTCAHGRGLDLCLRDRTTPMMCDFFSLRDK